MCEVSCSLSNHFASLKTNLIGRVNFWGVFCHVGIFAAFLSLFIWVWPDDCMHMQMPPEDNPRDGFSNFKIQREMNQKVLQWEGR